VKAVVGSRILDLVSGELAGLYGFMRALGISKRELEVYALIVSSNGLTASEISGMLNMPLSKVYETLSSLSSRGWIYKTAERPARYYSVPIRDVWEDIKRRLRKQIEKVEATLIPLLESATADPQPLFKVVLVDSARLPAFAKRTVERASKELMIALSYRELVTREMLDSIVSASTTKSVRVLVSESVASRLKEEQIELAVPVKTVKKMFGSGVIGDEILLVTRSNGTLQGLWSDHYYLVELGRVYFNYLWREGS